MHNKKLFFINSFLILMFVSFNNCSRGNFKVNPSLQQSSSASHISEEEDNTNSDINLSAGTQNISSVSGSLSSEGLLKINGVGFSSLNNEFCFLDHADSYSFIEGQNASSPVSQSNLWTQQGSNWAEPLLPINTKTNTGQSTMAYYGKKKAYMGWPELLKSQTNTSLYVSWMFRVSEDPGANGGSNKFIRIWDSSTGKYTRQAWDQDHVIHWRKDLDSSGKIEWGHWGGEVGSWNKIELWMDHNSHKMQIKTNGMLVIDVDDFNKSNVSEGLTVAQIGFDSSVSDKYPNIEFMLDDIYIANTRKRIVLSNESVWSEAKKNNQIQNVKSWRDNEIQIKISTSHLDSSKPLFLYIVNDSGAVQEQGYQIK